MDGYPNSRLWALLAISAALIICSSIFSASESAFLSINKLRVRLLRNKKNRRAERVWQLLKNKDKLINTLLIGNNIVNIVLSAILAYIAIELFGNAGVGIATFITTIILLIFGEISPKTIATHHPERIAFFFCDFIYFLEIILSPLVFLFTGFSRGVLKIFKVDVNKKQVSFTQEEIKTFIDVGLEQGVIENQEQKMMNRVFKFSDLEAHDIMVPRKNIKTISINESFHGIIEHSERLKLSRFPVIKNDIDDVVGILYVKDLMQYRNNIESFDIKKVMRPPLFILETKKMSSIQQMLFENRQSMAVVIDEYSGTNGILTVEDIVREIFGPVSDEYKSYASKHEIDSINSDVFVLDGLTRLADLNEKFSVKFTSQNVETLGGFLCEKFGFIPKVGDSLNFENYKMTVVKMDENRVGRVKFKKLEEA